MDAGRVILVSPLVALGDEQHARMTKLGLHSVCFMGDDGVADMTSLLDATSWEILIVSPERLVSHFMSGEDLHLPPLMAIAKTFPVSASGCLIVAALHLPHLTSACRTGGPLRG